MPCCALAAFILSQLVLAVAALRRFVTGAPPDTVTAPRNDVVAWRLVPGAAPGASPAALRRPRRVSARAFAIAACVEIVLLLGAIYGVGAHLGHVTPGRRDGALHSTAHHGP